MYETEASSVTSRQDRDRVSYALLAAAALVLSAAIAAAVLAIAPWLMAGWLVGGTVAFMLPGALVARVLYREEPGAQIAALLIGGVWGYAISSLALLALWAVGFRSGAILIAAPAVALLAAPVVRPLRGRFQLPRFSRGDLLACLLLLLIVPLVVGRPFARVGADLPDGRAYRAYFTADFVWRMAVVAEVSKGDVPPRNQFRAGEPLRYYWLPHLLPAVQHRVAPEGARLEQVLLINSLVLDLVFVAFLYALARQLVSSPAAAALGCAAAILFTSFEGAERIWTFWQQGNSLDGLRYINIDAVTRWYYNSLPVDGLHRLLLYQPHHAMGYAAGVTALLCAAQARDPGNPAVVLWLGFLLACSMLLSSFGALMITVMTAVYLTLRLAAGRRLLAIVPLAFVGAAPLAAGTALALWLQYVDRSETLIVFGLNQAAANRLWQSLTLSFGPVLPLALIGLAIGLWRRASDAAVFAVIVGVSCVFYFYVDVVDHQGVYVGWRAGHFTFIACAGLVGYALERLWRQGPWTRRTSAVVLAGLALAAAPTTVIDLYNTQDVTNRALGPGFRWTLVLSPDELEALDWIRRYTPPDALVQVEPVARSTFSWAYIPAFAERRMAAGLPISMVPLREYEAASERVRQVYAASDAATAHQRGRALGIGYLVVGPPEREAHPDFEKMLDKDPFHFRPVVRNGTMSIYQLSS